MPLLQERIKESNRKKDIDYAKTQFFQESKAAIEQAMEANHLQYKVVGGRTPSVTLAPDGVTFIFTLIASFSKATTGITTVKEVLQLDEHRLLIALQGLSEDRVRFFSSSSFSCLSRPWPLSLCALSLSSLRCRHYSLSRCLSL